VIETPPSAASGSVPAAIAPAPIGPSWLDDRSLRSWLAPTDHKRIGVLFLVGTTVFLLLGGVFALLLRAELLTPETDFLPPDQYNRLFTMHGVIMVWLFMIPAIPSGFGNFLVPLMIGAHDVAFPRINLASWYVYVLGGVLVLGGLFLGAADTGWTFYTPYSTTSPSQVAPVVIGIFVLGISSILSGINFIVTTHTLRAEGVTWFRIPLFVWTIYGTALIQVAATPVLAMALALVGVDHVLGWGVFDPSRGGDPILFQHLFWFYSHPAVYIMVLPGMGVVSEVVCTFAHRNPTSYTLLAVSSLGIAGVGFLTWGHHMFVSGMSAFDAGAFGALSMLVSIFSAIKVFTWTGTLWRGNIVVATPLLYVLAFLYLFMFGGMTGVAVATSSLDVHWHDTYFVVAHFHFIMVGGTLTAFLAAAHYWFPKITGRMYPERWGLVAASLVFAGFNLTFVPQFLLGNAGMPRRYATYPAEFQGLNVVSTVGSWVLGLAVVVPLVYLTWSMFRGRPAPPNPWGSRSFEWRSPTPPPPTNFPPEGPRWAIGPYDYDRELT
jgi:cytochrome c oxidase subunit 1